MKLGDCEVLAEVFSWVKPWEETTSGGYPRKREPTVLHMRCYYAVPTTKTYDCRGMVAQVSEMREGEGLRWRYWVKAPEWSDSRVAQGWPIFEGTLEEVKDFADEMLVRAGMKLA